jgi:hypothetical protein
MNGSGRGRFLLSKIEDVLSQPKVLRSPYLCSRLTPSNRIPLPILAQLPSLRNLDADESEILECCCRSKLLQVDASSYISPPYEIRPQCLIIRNASSAGAAFEIRDFILPLAGNTRFSAYPTVYPTGDGNDYAVHCETAEQCIAIWRALQIIPFRGQLLDLVAYSPTQLNPKQPNPVAPDPSPNKPTQPIVKTRAQQVHLTIDKPPAPT